MSGSYDRPTGPPDARSRRRLDAWSTIAMSVPLSGPPSTQPTRTPAAAAGQPPTPRTRSRRGDPSADHRADRAGRLRHRPLADARHHHHVLSRLPDGRRRLHDEPVGLRLAARHRQRGDGAGRGQGPHRRREAGRRRSGFLVAAAGHCHACGRSASPTRRSCWSRGSGRRRRSSRCPCRASSPSSSTARPRPTWTPSQTDWPSGSRA